MHYRREDSQERLAFYLEGRLEFSDHDRFREIINATDAARPQHCVLDLGGLEAIDSAGLGMLVIASEASEKGGWSLELHNARNQVRRMLELTDFGQVLAVTG